VVRVLAFEMASYKQMHSGSFFLLFAPAARRDSKKTQPKGPRRGQKKHTEGRRVLQSFFGGVLFVRKEIPGLRIAIAVVPHKMCSPAS
jgi:hypothetical protein